MAPEQKGDADTDGRHAIDQPDSESGDEPSHCHNRPARPAEQLATFVQRPDGLGIEQSGGRRQQPAQIADQRMGPHGASAYAFGRCWQIPIHIRLLGVPQPLLLFLIGSPDKRLELPDLAARFLKGCSGRRLTSPLVRRRPDQHSETLYPATENTTLETGNLCIRCASIWHRRDRQFKIAPLVEDRVCYAEVQDDDKRKSSPKRDSQFRRPTPSGKRLGIGSFDNRHDVRVGLLRESGKGPLQSGGLRWADQLLHQVEPLTGGMEVDNGIAGKPCGPGGSHAGDDGDLAGDPAGHRSAYPPSRLCRIPVPREPLDFGMGHVMDLGTTGSGARLARTRGGTRGTSLGHRRVASPAAPLVPVVVMSESACEYRSSFLLITKRRPLAMCLPICLPISSRRSSLSTAIRLTERPISRERWGHKSSRNLAEDTGALA